MGVYGLLSHCLENRDRCVEQVDLVEIARQRNGIELLCDFYSFEHLVLKNFWKSLSASQSNPYLRILGGDYQSLEKYVSKLVKDLKSLDIHLVMFVDGGKGSSKVGTEQKLETWKYRHHQDVNKLRQLLDVCRGNTRMSDLREDTAVRPVLLEVQFVDTLKSCDCEIVQCTAGEADFVIARNLQGRARAYAIVSNDSDFGIFANSMFIPNELFDFENDLQLGAAQLLPEKPIRLMAGVISSSRVVDLLELADHSQLVELSIIVGNDFTTPYVKKLKSRLGLMGKNRITAQAKWVKEHRNVENNPLVAQEIEHNQQFAKAVQRSREFYNLTLSDQDARSHDNLTCYLEDAIERGHLPANIMSMHNRFYWHRMLLEECGFDYPCSEIAMSDLRKYIYRMVLLRKDNAVVEYGRTPYEEFQSAVVHAAPPRGLPAANMVQREKIFQNLRTFHFIMLHMEPDFPINYFERYGRKNGFTCYILRYFLVQNIGFNLHITKDEFMALLAVALGKIDETWYQCLSLVPTTRCVTIGNWFQSIYRHGYMFIGKLLYLTHEFPEPKEIFSGSVWTAFYTLVTQEGMLVKSGRLSRESLHRIRRDKDGVIREKRHMIRHVVADIFPFSDRF